MIDPFHLEAYGKTTVNYNRDVEIFPVLRAMFEKIQGKCPYQSPTDMGVNMAGNCIIDDEVCREASRLEILRRYYTAQVSFVRGEADECQLRKLELVMQQAGVTPDICPAVAASLQKAEETGKPAGAMVLPDGRVVTGKTSSLLGASASLLLNALKAQGGVSDKLDLISAQVIEPISKLKIESLGHHNPRLHSDEVVVVKFSQKYFKAQQATLGVVNGQVEEVYSGHNVIKAFNREAAVLDDFNDANDKLYESAWKSQFLSGLMQPIMNFVGNLGYVAVAIVGSIFAAAGAITIGDIQAFIQYVKNFTQPIQQLAQVSNMLQSMTAAAERVFEFLNEPEEDQLSDPARRADPACIDGQVTFDHVKFGYTPEKTVIHNFSCNVKPGQKVAIVGPTGAGKTTMVKLLMRFYDVDSGEILLNGHNVRDFDRSDLREGFGMVLQDTWLFKGTIMENIRYGRLDATDEEVIAAAKAANADHFIRTLPGGYQMELNEDASNVSQGQKQLLTIARTILADNRILILDEATSSVDTRTEQRIQTAMDRLMQGRTSFVIAHRLSTIRDADLILVMREGDIVEQGTHDELIEAGGFYADLYNSQFEDVTA